MRKIFHIFHTFLREGEKDDEYQRNCRMGSHFSSFHSDSVESQFVTEIYIKVNLKFNLRNLRR